MLVFYRGRRASLSRVQTQEKMKMSRPSAKQRPNRRLVQPPVMKLKEINK